MPVHTPRIAEAATEAQKTVAAVQSVVPKITEKVVEVSEANIAVTLEPAPAKPAPAKPAPAKPAPAKPAPAKPAKPVKTPPPIRPPTFKGQKSI